MEEKLVQCESLLNPDDCLGTIVANLTETGEVSTTCSTEVIKYYRSGMTIRKKIVGFWILCGFLGVQIRIFFVVEILAISTVV